MITIPVEEKLATEIMFLRLFQIYGWEQYETAGGKERAFKLGSLRIIYEPNRDGAKFWNETPDRNGMKSSHIDLTDKELITYIYLKGL